MTFILRERGWGCLSLIFCGGGGWGCLLLILVAHATQSTNEMNEFSTDMIINFMN